MNRNKIDFLKELKKDSMKSITEKNNADNVDLKTINSISDSSNNPPQNNVYYINTLIKDKKFRIYCGDGRQKLRWLTDCAILKYESYYGGSCGIAYGIKLENGNLTDLEETINTILKFNENVWVLLKEEYMVYQEEVTKRNNIMNIQQNITTK